MTETQRKKIATAQRAYLAQDWADYDALVAEVSWSLDVSIDEAYQIVEDGPIVIA